METTKVIIENWPKANQFIAWMPIIMGIIAIFALLIAIYSAYLAKQSFITSSRPYVWASNYGVISPDRQNIIPIPFRVAYRVKNSPARIILSEVKISLNIQSLLVNTKQNFVRYPDETSEWNFTIGQEEFERIMNRPNEDKSKLVRLISLEYSSLDGGKIYHYELQQIFNPIANQWEDTSEKGD